MIKQKVSDEQKELVGAIIMTGGRSPFITQQLVQTRPRREALGEINMMFRKGGLNRKLVRKGVDYKFL